MDWQGILEVAWATWSRLQACLPCYVACDTPSNRQRAHQACTAQQDTHINAQRDGCSRHDVQRAHQCGGQACAEGGNVGLVLRQALHHHIRLGEALEREGLRVGEQRLADRANDP